MAYSDKQDSLFNPDYKPSPTVSTEIQEFEEEACRLYVRIEKGVGAAPDIQELKDFGTKYRKIIEEIRGKDRKVNPWASKWLDIIREHYDRLKTEKDGDDE